MEDRVLVVGSVNTDITAYVDTFPRAGETVTGRSISFNPGGKGNNQASAARRAGSSVAMVGRIGRDTLSLTLTDHFRSIGIDTSSLSVSDGVPTGSALIEVQGSDGQNKIAVIPGANNAVSPADVRAAEEKFVPGSVLVCQLEIPAETVGEALKLAKEKGMTTILNPAPAKAFPEEYYPLIDYFTPNETEAETFSGIAVTDEESAAKAAACFLEKGVKNVIITLGSRGSYFTDGEKAFITPAFRVTAVDTTGAGDAYNGALASSLARGETIEDAILFATAFSALSVTKKGAASSMPTREEAEAFLKNQSSALR